MDHLAVLRLFLRAADAAWRCQVSTVSRAVQALEEDLGAALFARSSRHLQWTAAGGPSRGAPAATIRRHGAAAALDGLGIALLPTWLVEPDIAAGALRRLPPDWEADVAPGPERAISAVYTARRPVSPQVRVFLDALAAHVGTPPPC